MSKQAIITTLMRVVLGIIFLAHGISKLQMGLSNVEGWFSSLGIPGMLGYIVAFIELIGGAMLIVGLFTRYVSVLLIAVLIGAIFTVKLSIGLLGSNEMAGYELDLSLLIVAIYLVFAERSKLSLDSMFNKQVQ